MSGVPILVEVGNCHSGRSGTDGEVIRGAEGAAALSEQDAHRAVDRVGDDQVG